MKFQYTHLKPGSLRVLRFSRYATPSFLHLWLEHLEEYQQDFAHYSVIAYRQGDTATGEQKSITLNGRSFMIPSSLWDALSAIVEHHQDGDSYWADAICINKGDPVEKAEQLGQINEILSCADRALFHAGEDEATATALTAWIDRATSCPYSSLQECNREKKHRVISSRENLSATQSVLRRMRTGNHPSIVGLAHNRLLSGGRQCDIELLHHYLCTSTTDGQDPRETGHPDSSLWSGQGE